GRLHGFRIEEVHAPFAGEAVSRYGHPLPAETRAACRDADAVLVALTREPAVEGVKADLDLTWRVQRVRLPDGDLAISRRAGLSAVGEGGSWEARVCREAERHPGVQVEGSTPSRALPALMDAPDRFCVIVA